MGCLGVYERVPCGGTLFGCGVGSAGCGDEALKLRGSLETSLRSISSISSTSSNMTFSKVAVLTISFCRGLEDVGLVDVGLETYIEGDPVT